MFESLFMPVMALLVATMVYLFWRSRRPRRPVESSLTLAIIVAITLALAAEIPLFSALTRRWLALSLPLPLPLWGWVLRARGVRHRLVASWRMNLAASVYWGLCAHDAGDAFVGGVAAGVAFATLTSLAVDRFQRAAPATSTVSEDAELARERSET